MLMHIYASSTFADLPPMIIRDFVEKSEAVDVGEWQSTDIRGDRSKVTWELREASLHFGMTDFVVEAVRDIQPNLPWAEDHFQERISGMPLNPPPSQAWWPFTQEGHSAFLDDGGKFSHTYPERFWPKHAGHDRANCPEVAEVEDKKQPGYYSDHWDCRYGDRRGIRFRYGDYNDVLGRLIKNPLTRQAYLPIYFPEDNGAREGERVPCTLGYLFLIRNNRLHLTYHIRSCDFMRHWRDDVYMGMRLAQQTMDQLNYRLDLPSQITLGDMAMHIGSFHVFEGDLPMLQHLNKNGGSNA
jgi:hypothetical protein